MPEWMKSSYDKERTPVPPYIPDRYFMLRYPETQEQKYQADLAFMSFQKCDRANFKLVYRLLRSRAEPAEFKNYLDNYAKRLRRRLRDEHKDLRKKFLRDWSLTEQCVFSNRLENVNYYFDFLDLQSKYTMYKCCTLVKPPHVAENSEPQA